MEVTMRYTHKGWMGFCPIYVGDLDAEWPCLKARHWSLDWLLDLSVALMDAAMFCIEAMGGQPRGYMIHIGDELDAPMVDKVEA